MAPSTIRRALGAVKDRTSISIAKVSSSTSISDLEIAIVKVTRHNEYPPEEKYIREILSLTCYSRHLIGQCVALLSRRLGKTRSWDVALKTLILIHRLLCEGDPSYEEEIFFATRRGTRMLNLSDFRDTKSSTRYAWDFSAFVRTYARYLDEMLEFRMHGKKGMTTNRSRSRQMVLHDLQVVDDEEEEEEKKEGKGAYWTSSSTGMELVVAVRTTPVHEMKSERVFSRIQHLMQLLDRFLACRPTGPAKNHRIVAMALLPVIKESFLLYGDIQETMAVFIDRFMELSLPDCVRIHDIFSRLSKQLDDLERFYSWTRTAGIARSCEFPAIERITQQKLDVMDEFIRDRSNLSSKKQKSFEQLTLEEDAKRQADEAAKEYSSIKALPAPQPESEPEPEPEPEHEPTPEPKPEEQKAIVKVKDDGEADFLNLGGDYMSLNNHADNLALALFDVNINNPSNASTVPPWQAFDNSSTDWETSLVETASHLPAQNATFGGGFDMLLLDGMYSQPRAPTFADGNGSASSVALPRAESAPMLALPAPPVTGILVAPGGDPFAASAMVPAPSYVQMWDMERKQGMLVEEQVMWQNYARNGMQGQVNLGKYQQQHPMGGGYIQRF